MSNPNPPAACGIGDVADLYHEGTKQFYRARIEAVLGTPVGSHDYDTIYSGPEPVRCKGKNCSALVNGEHSPECVADHEAACMSGSLPPPPIDALRWLYSHCKALGMKRKSESGQIEHDIALFIADLHRDLNEIQRRGNLAGYAGFGITPYPNHPGRWLSVHRPGLNFPSAHAAYMDAFGVKGAPT